MVMESAKEAHVALIVDTVIPERRRAMRNLQLKSDLERGWRCEVAT
jgi:hypothetical protein